MCPVTWAHAIVRRYKMHMMKGDMPRVITMFSAPNYCDTYRNNGLLPRKARVSE